MGRISDKFYPPFRLLEGESTDPLTHSCIGNRDRQLAGSTHRAFVGFFPGVDAHVDEEFVARVEGSVSPLTRRPETGEIVAFPLVNVRLLNVSGQGLATAEEGIAVHPPTAPGSIFLRG